MKWKSAVHVQLGFNFVWRLIDNHACRSASPKGIRWILPVASWQSQVESHGWVGWKNGGNNPLIRRCSVHSMAPSFTLSFQSLMDGYYLGGTHRYPWKQDGCTLNAWLSSLSGKKGHTDWYDTLHSLPCHKYIYSTRLLLPSARFVRGSVVGNQEFFMSLSFLLALFYPVLASCFLFWPFPILQIWRIRARVITGILIIIMDLWILPWMFLVER